VDALAVDLSVRRQSLGETGTFWRLLLALHVGRAGYVSLAERLLAPLLESLNESETTRDRAYQILDAVSGGGGADLRLYRQALLMMYQQSDESSDLTERLAIVSALANINSRLGSYSQALRFGVEELELRLVLFHADHVDTLAVRGNVAYWTGRTGDLQKALALFEALLPDQVRVLGPDHPNTLATRSDVAHWTGETGSAEEALALFEALLSDEVRVLGPDHPEALATREIIDILRATSTTSA
jgi:hypothetical protein